ncbi:MAG: class II aldolase/adducin family protein [Desulfobulbus sp.]|jgi:L-fuculose-phosphate aldolase
MISAMSAREQVLATARKMNAMGLNQGSSGNVSVRDGQGFLITPSALPYDLCEAADMVWLDLDGQPADPTDPANPRRRRPSSEWRMHAAIYQSCPQAGAVLHTHSIGCTALACLERSIPAFHYMVALAGGDSIRCAPYQPFGTEELAQSVIEGLRDRTALLLAHHGLVCYAGDLSEVLNLAAEIEALARMYLQVVQVCPDPPLLSREQMDWVLHRFADYKRVESA